MSGCPLASVTVPDTVVRVWANAMAGNTNANSTSRVERSFCTVYPLGSFGFCWTGYLILKNLRVLKAEVGPPNIHGRAIQSTTLRAERLRQVSSPNTAH